VALSDDLMIFGARCTDDLIRELWLFARRRDRVDSRCYLVGRHHLLPTSSTDKANI
jgi:hypothetical protein